MSRRIPHAVFVILAAAISAGADGLQIRPKNFIVTPSTGPVAELVVKNGTGQSYTGTLTPKFPEGWIVSPLSRPVTLQSGESATLSFAIEKAFDLKENVYAVSVSADSKKVLDTKVVCATTPYFTPKIDGDLDEWGDAVPVSFMTGGKKTTVRSYWNKDQFCLAVEVEENELIGLADGSAERGVDAIQFALAPGGSVTPNDPQAAAVRYEYLVAASGSRWKSDKCFQLLRPGDSLTTAAAARALQPLELEEAQVKVIRSGGVTRYELAVPVKPMKTLKVTAGREYCFSLLVHDPDGTGVRDLGTVMNLWNESRNPLAWCNWAMAKWNGYRPFDNKIEFGFCSSVH